MADPEAFPIRTHSLNFQTIPLFRQTRINLSDTLVSNLQSAKPKNNSLQHATGPGCEIGIVEHKGKVKVVLAFSHTLDLSVRASYARCPAGTYMVWRAAFRRMAKR